MATKYVATTGNDTTGTGLVGAPWATLAKALNTVATGDTIQMRGGTYSQTFKNGRDTVIIENYAGENVVIQRTSAGSVLFLENSRNITLRKNVSGGTFTVRSTVAGNGSSSGVHVHMAGGGSPGYVPSNILIDGVTIENIAGWGIQIVDASAVVVQNVDVSHCGTGIRFRRVTGASFIQDSSSHHTDRMIRSDATANNDNGGTGIAVDACVGVTVRRNLLYENHAPSVDYEVDGGAIELYESSQCVLEDNIAYNNQGFCETGTGSATTYPMPDNIIRRNLVYGRLNYKSVASAGFFTLIRAGTNLRVENNTVDVDDGGACVSVNGATGGFSAPIHNLKIKNNILVSRNAPTRCLIVNNVTGTTGIQIDYNLLYNSTGSSAIVADANNYGGTRAGTALAAFQTASPFSDNDVWNDDPDFVNRTVRDYTLQGTSPAIDQGVVISGTTTGFVGAAPDIGKFEYAVSPPPGGAPDPPVITTPAADGLNSSGIVTIAGTAEDLSNVELFDGATSKGSTPVVGGAWSFSLPLVADGVHTYTAYATDAALDTSTVSNTRIVTVETSAPEVSSSVPADGATGVAVGANVVVTFSEAMDPATITTASFRVLRAGVPVAGSIAMSVGDTVATFNPTTDLAAGTTYTVELSSVIKDVAGNSLT